MEGLAALAVLLLMGLVLLVIVGSVLGIAAMVRVARLWTEAQQLKRRTAALEKELAALRAEVEKQAAPPAIVLKQATEAKPEPAPSPTPAPEPEKPAPPPTEAPPPPPPEFDVAAGRPRVEKPEPAPEVVPVEAEAEAPEEVPAAAATPAVEEPEPPEPSPWARIAGRLDQDWWAKVEETVGKRWLVYLGGLAVFVSVCFFIKYAFDKEWITPTMVVLAGIVVGAGFVAAGHRFVRKGMRPLGLGLIGAPGLPVLYVSIYAAQQVYGLIPQWASFGSMIVVTVAGMALALLHDSIVISFLSVLGGLLTPLLVATGVDPRDPLFGYLLILNLGVLGVAFVRKWRALDILAFVGTAFLFTGWYFKFYDPEAMVPTLLWLGAFYLTFLVIPFAYHLRQRSPATLERFIMALVVAAGVFAYARAILYPGHQHALAYVVLIMATCYGTLGSMARQRVPTDVRSVFSFLAFAMMFATLAAPLRLGLNATTLSWAGEAVLLLYLGYRFAYLPARVGGLIVLALAVLRIFLRHWPPQETDWTLALNTRFGVAAGVCAAGGVFAAIHHWWREKAALSDRAIKVTVAIASGALALLVCHWELGRWLAARAKVFGVEPHYLSRTAGGLVWTVGSLSYLAASVHWRSLATRVAGIASLGIATLLLMTLYVLGVGPGGGYFANARFWVSLGVVAASFAHTLVLYRVADEPSAQDRDAAATSGVLAGFALLVVLHIELAEWLGTWGVYEARCGVATLWMLGAVAFLLVGLRLPSLTVRMAGLVALGVGVALGVRMYGPAVEQPLRKFANARFGVVLLQAAVAVAWGYVLRHVRPPCNEEEEWPAEPLYILAGMGLLAAASVDGWQWLSRWGRYPPRYGLPLIWLAGTWAFLAAGVRWRSLARRGIALACLAATAALVWALYGWDPPPDLAPFLNARFAIALAVGAAMLGHGLVLRRFPEACGEDERPVGEALYVAGGIGLTLVMSLDLHDWLARWGTYQARCGTSALWSAAAAAFAAAGIWRRSQARRFMALGVLALAAVLAAQAFAPGLVQRFYLLFNLRFAVCLLAVLVLFGIGFAIRRWPERCLPDEQQLARVLYWLGMGLLFLILSVDAWLYSKVNVADDQAARLSARMLLSFVWSGYAIALLAVGFWKRVRPVRLTALALFGLTAVKLVIVDLTFLETGYRILSFLVVGLLMIGASYLYHRVEKAFEGEAPSAEG